MAHALLDGEHARVGGVPLRQHAQQEPDDQEEPAEGRAYKPHAGAHEAPTDRRLHVAFPRREAIFASGAVPCALSSEEKRSVTLKMHAMPRQRCRGAVSIPLSRNDQGLLAGC